ncbi:hypothetical protein CSAL01_07552 [Colletotrichum salicis]|uniref:Uncharacterized protein n=1 Tax=Colletotrichum salicis TaxID=1209931 RepID=A0A135UKV3_9PEZI|nr:hypothetical protein CSAL01_07552 [Colletotrichum salicis]
MEQPSRSQPFPPNPDPPVSRVTRPRRRETRTRTKMSTGNPNCDYTALGIHDAYSKTLTNNISSRQRSNPRCHSVTFRDTAVRKDDRIPSLPLWQAPKTQSSSNSPPTQDPLGPVPTLEQPPDPSNIQRDVVQDVY